MARTSNAEEIAFVQASEGFERRKQPRFHCAGPAYVVVPEAGSLYYGHMKDLSLTGCYIVGDPPLDLERRERVELSLWVEGESLRTPARVILVRPDSGAAFEFLPIDRQMRSCLLNLLQKLSGESGSQDASPAR